ncbi:MAG: DNA polymerase I [Clostridia bacterium]|nr:DNA polymerase I [Clostridia bacterium]
MNKLLLIDGNSILNRAYFAMMGNRMLSTAEGLPTNAIFGFLNTYDKFAASESPTHAAVAFDTSKPTFRHGMYDGYKAGRKPMPDDLAAQLPVMKDILDRMGITRLELPGYEADDILGTLVEKARGEGCEVVVLTGDRDMMQLAGEKTVIRIPTTAKGTTTVSSYDRDSILNEFGIEPNQFIEVKALMGDKSDNIPGIAGIGMKTALDLVAAYGSLEGIYENIDKIKSDLQKTKLESGRESAFLSRDLARIKTDVPLSCGLEALKIGEMDGDALLDIFKKLEFNSFIKKYGLKRQEKTSIEYMELDAADDSIRHERLAVHCEFDSNETPVAFAYTVDGVNVYKGSDAGALKKIMTDAKTISGHYLKNLLVYLLKEGVPAPAVAFDSATAAYLADALKDTYGIDELCEKYLGAEFPKDGGAAACAAVINRLESSMMNVIGELGMTNLLEKAELPLIEVLASMEYLGFRADRKFLEDFSKRLGREIEILENRIYEEAGGAFNINSPRQLGTVLFEKLGMPYGKKMKTGYSTNAEVLGRLAEKYPFVKLILEYRQLAKLKSTYADGLAKVIGGDGRIHSTFRQTVTATGRLSSTEPNLQNLPIRTELGREIRKAFIPGNDEFLITSADYSQIELRILAHVADDTGMKQAFINKEDIHTQTAARVFGVDDRFVTKEMRRAAKAVNFGIIYGISDFGLSEDLDIPVYTAKDYIQEYFRQYKGIRKYMDDVVDFAQKNGYVRTIFGRRRYIPELNSKAYAMREFGKRVALNAPIQGAAADIIKMAMVDVYKSLAKNRMKSRLILQIHDELVVETHRDEVDEVEGILRECMMGAAELSVPLEVDVRTGKSLYDTK